MLNRSEITLNENEYFIHYYKELRNWFEKLKKEDLTIELNGKTLHCKEMTDKNYASSWNSSYYLLVVPDEYVSGMLIENTRNAINTEKEITTSMVEEVKNRIGNLEITSSMNGEEYTITIDTMTIRKEVLDESRSAITIFSFSLTYLALVFIAVVGTILSIQTLSDATKYKYRYDILKKLGVREKEIDKTILKQVTMNFIFPIVYPLLIAVITTFSLNRLFFNISSEEHTYLYSLGNSIFLFLLIYGIYFLATYIGFKKNKSE